MRAKLTRCPAALATGKSGGACYNKTLTIASFETIVRIKSGVKVQLAGQQILCL
jgi:hypothetical protein